MIKEKIRTKTNHKIDGLGFLDCHSQHIQFKDLRRRLQCHDFIYYGSYVDNHNRIHVFIKRHCYNLKVVVRKRDEYVLTAFHTAKNLKDSCNFIE